MISVVLSVITFTRIRYHSHATEIKKQFAHIEWNPINVIIERVKTKTHKIGASETQTQNLQTRCHWIFWFCYFGCNVSLLWVANWWCEENKRVRIRKLSWFCGNYLIFTYVQKGILDILFGRNPNSVHTNSSANTELNNIKVQIKPPVLSKLGIFPLLLWAFWT